MSLPGSVQKDERPIRQPKGHLRYLQMVLRAAINQCPRYLNFQCTLFQDYASLAAGKFVITKSRDYQIWQNTE